MYNTISNNMDNPHYPFTDSTSQNETTDTISKEKPFSKIILIVDDDPDVGHGFQYRFERCRI